MSRYRRVEQHLGQLVELQSILSSMKTLSRLELHKLAGVIESQNAMVRTLRETATDFLKFFPRAVVDQGRELWLVFGSERSFCGGFNELLVRRLLREFPACSEHPQRVLAIGRKLCERLKEVLPGHVGMAGASCNEEVQSVLTEVVAATQDKIVQDGATAIRVLSHDNAPKNISLRRLLPPEELTGYINGHHPPLLHVTPDRFFSQFLEHYLLLGLTQVGTVSLLAENEYRIRHLEGAIRRLDERMAQLTSRARTMRQEEIIEEIEVILLGSGAFGA